MTTHPPPLPEVERFQAQIGVDSVMRPVMVECVRADAFAAHVAAYLDHLGEIALENERLLSAVRLLREQVSVIRELTCHDCVPCQRIDDAADKALADTEKWGSK